MRRFLNIYDNDGNCISKNDFEFRACIQTTNVIGFYDNEIINLQDKIDDIGIFGKYFSKRDKLRYFEWQIAENHRQQTELMWLFVEIITTEREEELVEYESIFLRKYDVQSAVYAAVRAILELRQSYEI